MSASPYLTTREAALYLRFEYPDGSPNLNAFYIARCRHRIRACRRGGKLLFRPQDLDAFLVQEGRELAAFRERSTLQLLSHAPKVGRAAR